jgi:heterodisulfide reductase subunit A
MVAVAQHPNIQLMTMAEVVKVDGYIGNFKVTIKKRAKYVDWDLCTGCGTCMEKCPTKKIPDAFDMGMGQTTAVRMMYPQAVPGKPYIDAEHCTKLLNGKCGICEKVCPTKAIRYEDKEELVSEDIGAIVMATGFDLLNGRKLTVNTDMACILM